MNENRVYIAIDLKSFYASVECRERELDPLTTNLVVADQSRTDKTICLAVSPSLKAYGIPGRPRLFEVVQKVRQINQMRRSKAPGHRLTGASFCDLELRENPALELDYIVAVPRMALYMDYSTRIYQVYLKYIAPEDIHVYSIDEVFMDVTSYLKACGMTPREFAKTVMQDVLKTTGITATAGIGTNLYLAKVAMDIVAKHTEPDFWRVGRGYAKKLEENGLYTMGDIARCSIGRQSQYYNEELLYKLFGVNAELLIDHAWGYEPCTLEMVKSYKPASNSLGSGQVLQSPYSCEKARLVVREMTDLLVLDLVEKGLVTDQIVLTVGYDRENLTDPKRRRLYRGEVKTDHYGRKVPKHAHGTVNLERQTSSTRLIVQAAMELYDRIVDKNLLIRRVSVTVNRVIPEGEIPKKETYEQLDLFTDYAAQQKKQREEERELEKEKNMQKAMLRIRNKYGKNAILKGMNLEEGATARERNEQIGGHKA